MSQLALANYAYRRGDGLVPSIRVENVYAEQSPAELVTGTILLTRAALQVFGVFGSGPNRCAFWEDNVFDNDALLLQGDALYRITRSAVGTALGTVAGTGPARIAASPTIALIATGGPLLQTDGVTITAKAFPLDQDVVSVGYINGYFLAVPRGSPRIYYTDLVTGEFDEQRFIAAERYPDNIVDLIVTSDEIWALGAASTEVFVPTGVDTLTDPPFQRVEGRLYKKGLSNLATVAKADNTVFWVGPAEEGAIGVFRGDAVPVGVHDESIAERLGRADPADLRGWVFGHAKHIFYVLAMGAEGTWVYDVLTNRWFNWTSHLRDQWRAHLGRACWPGVILAGDDETGTVWKLSDTATTDDAVPIVQVFTAGIPVSDSPSNWNLRLDCAVGQAAVNDNIPLISMRYSDDHGRTWSDPESVELGAQGEYDVKVVWNRLGTMVPPVRIFEWTVSHPVRMRVSAARINEAA